MALTSRRRVHPRHGGRRWTRNHDCRVFGTGFRYAGGASPASPPADVSGHVTAIASDPQGHSWQLPVLYAGPAPGYEGLDQINIQFVDSINTEADLTPHPLHRHGSVESGVSVAPQQDFSGVLGCSPGERKPGILDNPDCSRFAWHDPIHGSTRNTPSSPCRMARSIYRM